MGLRLGGDLARLFEANVLPSFRDGGNFDSMGNSITGGRKGKGWGSKSRKAKRQNVRPRSGYVEADKVAGAVKSFDSCAGLCYAWRV